MSTPKNDSGPKPGPGPETGAGAGAARRSNRLRSGQGSPEGSDRDGGSRAGGRYHHGNVREATLDGARQMLTSMPAHQISLREVARLVGISHAAPYKHFPDRTDFLAALAARCMTEFVSGQRTAIEGIDDPGRRLLELGASYVSFAISNPHAFVLIFDVEVSPPGNPPAELVTPIAEHAALLREGVQAAIRSGILATPAEPEDVATGLWSLVHGLAYLAIAGRIPTDRVRHVLRAQLRLPPSD